MRDGAVVAHAANGVDEDGDDEDEPKDAARPDVARLVRLSQRAGVHRAGFEKVGAFLWVGADKGKGGCGAAGVTIAKERDDGRFRARIRCRLVAVGRCGLLLAGALLGRGFAAGRAAAVSKHKFATAAVQVHRRGAVENVSVRYLGEAALLHDFKGESSQLIIFPYPIENTWSWYV